ncbi:tRNA lysidine(34) synthetase TilS [Candidatus Peregrinibacteria bacterium]|nr:tRNA lysidine(34) synthetase TilS [Candidatus Peregrinibacteria bacterium]
MLKTIQKTLATLPPFRKVVVGVSGGADSVALAHILIQLKYNVTIAHLNHGLRGKESDADEAFVEHLAKKWKVPCVTHKIQLSAKGNTENSARLIRYAFLEKVRIAEKAEFIAIAHHLDDQIETILMHMQRGAGLRGLCGMQLKNGNVIRPLLGLRKKELEAYLKKEKVGFRTDASNFDQRFRRNLFRHRIIPELRKKYKDLDKKLLRLSAAAQKRLETIEKKAAEWMRKNVTDFGFGRLEFLKLSDAVQSEVLFQIIGYRDVYRKSIEKIKALIKKGITGKQKQIGPLTFKNQYDRITFFRGFKAPKSPKPVRLTAKEIRWGKWALKYDGNEALFARPWQKGDRFKPAGMRGSKKLQDFFVDRKIPKSERHQIPIITDKTDRIVSVAHFRVAKDAVHLKQCLKISRI